MEKKIVIFDLDGVLIKPTGYRKATRDTVVHFLEVYQIKANPPCESDLSLFESVGITCEWDMIPLSLLAAMNESACQTGGQNSNGHQANSPTQLIRVDYQAYIRAYARLVRPGIPPSEAVSRYCATANGQNLFPCVQMDRIEKLLDNTRDFSTCPTTQYLENFVVGSQIFEQIFKHPAMVACPSYLETEDTVLLTQAVSQALMAAKQSKELSFAMMTARYSSGPADLPDQSGLKIPEAEIAARMLGWEAIPLIGFGHLIALGESTGRSAEDLLKPQPVHALAAILAASGLPEWVALQEALRIYEGGDWQGFKEPVCVHVVEDSPVGIMAVRQAVEILAKNNPVTMQAWGVTQDANKKASLMDRGALVFDTVDQAVLKILAS